MVESKFASDSMSNMKPKILSINKALARYYEKALALTQKREQLSGQQSVTQMLQAGQPSTPAPVSPSSPNPKKDASKQARKK
ncbi:hypothetical protein ACOSP7_014560 [Xanthoceras sorbifolium]